MSPLSQSSSIVCALSALLAAPNMARAGETKQQCVQAYEDAQTAKRTGKFLEATTDLLLCSSSECPEVMHADCQGWLAEVEASIPTVVFRVTSVSGAAPEWAMISVDGADPVALDGRAISVDPGRHTVVFSARGLRTTAKTFDFSEGEKLRREVILLAPAESSPESGTGELPQSASEQRSSGFRLTLPLTLAASATVLGAVGATYFGINAHAADRDLDHCTPNCSRDVVNRVRREYLLTNVSLGVAAVGLVTTTVVVLLQSSSGPSSPSTHVAVDAAANRIHLSLSGRF